MNFNPMYITFGLYLVLVLGIGIGVFGIDFFQAFFFLLQPRRVIAFPRNTVSAVKFQNPFGGVV